MNVAVIQFYVHSYHHPVPLSKLKCQIICIQTDVDFSCQNELYAFCISDLVNVLLKSKC